MADAILGKDMKYPLKLLTKHFICLGSTGSGKTVLSKALIEEAAINGIPSIIVDPQGDLASLAIPSVDEKTNKERAELFQSKAEVVVFTPTSSKGIPLCVNPLKLPKKNIYMEDAVSVLNQISSSVTKLIGYDLDKDAGKNAQAVLYLLLHDCWKKEIHLSTFDELSNLVLNLPESVKIEGAAFVNDAKALAQLAKKIKFLTIGEKELMFQSGLQLDIDTLLGKGKDKTQISIIYLNSLETMEEKQFFVSMLATELYQWMLSNPSKELQALFMIDEVSSFIPAGAEKPMAKEILKLIYKQARKYGIGCITGTQNPGDIDYKAFAQFGTWALGRMVTKQDIAKVKTALEAVGAEKAEKALSSLPSLKPGQFFMFCPDLFKDVKEFSVRWLLTEHKTLTDDDVRNIISDETREHYAPYIAVKREGKKEAVKKGNGVLHFPVNISKEEAQKIIEGEKKKLFFFFGPDRENVESLRLVAVPLLRVHAFATKKGLFKDKTERFTVYFDAVDGNLAVLDTEGGIDFFETSKLLSLNETE
ncbi:MAG: helicase HerA-like domain-containing protein, partial [Nanoarchaeota archaeon]